MVKRRAGARTAAPHPRRAARTHETAHHTASEGRKAAAVDPDAKARNLTRLRRIEGQVRGLQKMVEDDRYCADILTQIAAVHEALRAVGRELMRNHLKHCATTAIRSSEAEASAMYEELLDLMYTHPR
jgi:DNA-binding FrmR family transcriptional regulator